MKDMGTKEQRERLVEAMVKQLQDCPVVIAAGALHTLTFHITESYEEFDRLRMLAYDLFASMSHD